MPGLSKVEMSGFMNDRGSCKWAHGLESPAINGGEAQSPSSSQETSYPEVATGRSRKGAPFIPQLSYLESILHRSSARPGREKHPAMAFKRVGERQEGFAVDVRSSEQVCNTPGEKSRYQDSNYL
jgi:hypothetical protein